MDLTTTVTKNGAALPGPAPLTGAALPGPAPVPESIEAELRSRPGMDPALFRWVGAEEAGALIGVSGRVLRLWASGQGPHQPPMPHRMQGRRVVFQTAICFHHLRHHGIRNGPNFRAPAGWVEPGSSGGVAEVKSLPADVVAELGGKGPREALLSIFESRAVQDELGPERIRALCVVVQTLARWAEMETRNASRFDERDLVEVADDVRDLFVAGLEQGVQAAVDSLMGTLQGQLGIDLSAHPQVRSVIHEVLAGMVDRVSAHLRSEVAARVEEVT